jgi:hypothetical protein
MVHIWHDLLTEQEAYRDEIAIEVCLRDIGLNILDSLLEDGQLSDSGGLKIPALLSIQYDH